MIEDPIIPFDGGPSACPFVAFEDDRDHRSSSPDYRHRCFAAPEPEPRAFPHQERFCLSAGFAQCPIFLDWARQEAAGVNVEADASAAIRAGGAAGAVAATNDEDGPAFLAARPRTTLDADAGAAARRAADVGAGLWSYDGDAGRSPAPSAPPPPSSLREPAVAMARRGPSHPGWENPPRLETFPRLRSREEHRANQPLLFVAVGMALVMASLVLFPIIMNGKGSGQIAGGSSSPGAGGSATPSASASASNSSAPGTSFIVYIVKKTDVTGLSGIAAKYNITLPNLIAANPQIKNPNVIWEGMPINIPPIGWQAPTPAPSAGASAGPT